MASIKKRSNKWSARISYRDETGKRHVKSKGGFARKREAEQWANGIEQQKYDDSIGKIDQSLAFSDYYADWLNTYKQGKVARITYQEYQYTLHMIQELLAGVPLSKMTRMRYQKFINEFTYGNVAQRKTRHLTEREVYHSKASVQKLHGHIHSAVLDAVADGLIKQDFCMHAELGGHVGKSAQLKYLDADDMQKLIDEVSKNIRLTSTSKSMIYTGLMTGMRVGEVSALTWSDINWDNETITINKSWDYAYGTGFKPAKTESSNRTITVTPALLNHLRRLHALQMSARLNNPLKLVFLNSRCRVPNPGACDLLLKKYHTELGIKRISFHGLRHTHASYLLYKGVKMEYISKRLGHSNTSITRNVYAHLIKEDQKAEQNLTRKVMDELSN